MKEFIETINQHISSMRYAIQTLKEDMISDHFHRRDGVPMIPVYDLKYHLEYFEEAIKLLEKIKTAIEKEE